MVLRLLEDGVHGALFHQVPVLHDGHAIGEAAHQVEVVRDHQHRHAVLPLQVGQQVEDLLAQGDVERGGGFVRQQQPRPAGQGHRDHGALPLSARELVRVTVGPALRFGNAGGGQRFHSAVPGLAGADALLQLQHFGDLVADGVDRVQGRHRLLEDHGDVTAADADQLTLRRLQQFGGLPAFDAGEPGRAGDAGVVDQPDEAEGGDGLAGARFAHQRQLLAGRDREVDAVQDFLVAEGDAQVSDFEQGAALTPALSRRRERE